MALSSRPRPWWEQGRVSAEAAAILGIFLAVLHCASAKEYPVGDTGVWDFGEYQGWANRTRFFVGDKIVFNYSPRSHDVITLSQADFTACAVSLPIAKYSTGADSVTLDKAGTVYFSCDLPGHCDGMKFFVNVQASADAIPPSPSSKPAPSPSAASSVRAALATLVAGAGVVALLL